MELHVSISFAHSAFVQMIFDVPRQLGAFAGATPLLSGDSGTAQTVSLIKKLVESAVKDPAVNAFSIAIVRNVQRYDKIGQCKAVFDWVNQNVQYVMDPIGPDGPKETLRPMRDLMSLLAGDCDDINGVFIPSVLGSLGYETRVVTIKADSEVPSEFSHIYCEVLIDGYWYAMDCAREGAEFGDEPPFYWERKEWPITQQIGFTLLGRGDACGCGGGCAAPKGLAGYVNNRPGSLGGYGLGDDSTTAQDISAATSGAAAVISAANQNPYSFISTSNLTNVTPQLGYGMPGIGASINFSSYLPLIIGGVFLLALLGGRK